MLILIYAAIHLTILYGSRLKAHLRILKQSESGTMVNFTTKYIAVRTKALIIRRAR